MKKILLITPRFPFETVGACEQDRTRGILHLKKLGYDVTVIVMTYPRHALLIDTVKKEFGVEIVPIVYSRYRLTRLEKFLRLCKRVIYPPFWDGAAFEYTDFETQAMVRDTLKKLKPDLVWCDYSYLWPLYHLMDKVNVPVITRGMIFEPDQYIDESNKTPIDWMKYYAKLYSEKMTVKKSSLIFAITPKEKFKYEQLGSQNVVVLPLRKLESYIGKNPATRTRNNLNLIFMGSNFQVEHMMRALKFILDDVNPVLQKRFPDTFTIHVLGKRIPEVITSKKYPGVIFHGFVPDLDSFIEDMDIALSPSLSGEGMQQKVFEPIVRGIPTVTSDRALAGYPFVDGIHVRTAANTTESFVGALESLMDVDMRMHISRNAIEMSKQIFSEETVLATIDWNIKKLLP